MKKHSQRTPGQKASKSSVPDKAQKGAAAAEPQRKARAPRTSLSHTGGPRVVGIGASAGGLEAFTQFLQALSPDTGMAFVLVQHLEPTHESILPKLLARATKMQVHEARDRMRVEPNHIYVIPANADLSLTDGALHMVVRRVTSGHYLPIDIFFNRWRKRRNPARSAWSCPELRPTGPQD